MKANVSRRAVLSATGGLFAGVAANLRIADASGTPGAKRLIVITQGHGLGSLSTPEYLAPMLPSAPLNGTIGPTAPTLKLLNKLPSFMSPLAGLESKITIVDGLYNRSEDQLHGSRRGTYTCRTADAGVGDDQADGPGAFHGPSFEYLISRKLGTPGIYLGGDTPYNYSFFASATSAGIPAEIPLLVDPTTAFAQVFGSASGSAADVAALKQRLTKRKSVLDYSQAHLGRIRNAIPATERGKLDQYESSLRDLEKQLAQRIDGAANCTASADTVLGPPATKKFSKLDQLNPPLARQLKQQADILVNALSCGTSRVGVLQISRETDYSVYPGLSDNAHVGQTMKHNLHTLYHAYQRDDWADEWNDFSSPQPNFDEMRLYHQRFLAEQVAYLVDRLDGVPDATDSGGGTLLDNTLILWMSDSGGSHHGGAALVRAVLIGGQPKAGRVLQYPRLYVGDYPKQGNGTTIYNANRGNNFKDCYSTADLFVSVMRSFGLDETRFGDEMYCRGPLPNLEL